MAVEVLEDLFFIERGYLSGNHFVHRSPTPVLIDSAYASEVPKTLAAVSAVGCDWRRTARLICTHSHCDHVGANAAIQQASGCEIVMHPLAKQFADAGDRRSPWYDFYLQEAPPFRCTAVLEDGVEVPMGRHRFRTLHTPGHSADGIVLYDPAAKILLSSDVLWQRDIPVVTEAVEGEGALDQLLTSLERLRSLDIRRVFPGHGAPFGDARTALDRAETRVRAYREDRARLGDDLLKRILVYTLLMKGPFEETAMFPYLQASPWFTDTMRRYFDDDPKAKYRDTLEGLLKRGVVRIERGRLVTTVRP